jgi:hypothetical protein
VSEVGSSGSPWPAEDVLLELGRVTWAAMDLEGAAEFVCRSVIGAGPEVTKAPTRRQVEAALDVLKSWPVTPERDQGMRWLRQAGAALGGRNDVLHAQVVTVFHRDEAGRLTEGPGTWLQRVRCRGDVGPVMALSAESLARVRQVLVEASGGWVPVVTALCVIRDQRWKGGQIDRSSLTKPSQNRYGDRDP